MHVDTYPQLDDAEQYPSSASFVSTLSQQSATSSTYSTSSVFIHNPYSLSHCMVDVSNGYDGMNAVDIDPLSDSNRGTMVLITADDGSEIVISRAEVVQKMRSAHGFVDSEVATPCEHFGRCRLRYKNSITHCRCRVCGSKWREIAYSRIRPEQMDAFQTSFSAARLLV